MTRLLVTTIVLILTLTVPVRAAEYPIPDSIPADCSMDTTDALVSWLASVPDGNTASLATGGCYRIDGTVELLDRIGLNIVGNGATLRAGVPGLGTRAHVRVIGGIGSALRDITIHGANPFGPVHTYDMQWQHGLDLRGPGSFLAERVRVEDVYGDSFYLGKDDRTGANSRNVHVVDARGERAGRVAGVAFVGVSGATVTRGFYELAGLTVFDVEPNNGNTVEDVLVQDCEVGRWPSRQWQWPIVGPPSGTQATVRRITLRGCRFIDSPLTVWADLAGDKLTIQDVRIENNISVIKAPSEPPAPIMLKNVDGAAIFGNTIPLNAGQYGISACNVTGLAYGSNSFPGGAGTLIERRAKRC
jgi:hypothetical protein